MPQKTSLKKVEDELEKAFAEIEDFLNNTELQKKAREIYERARRLSPEDLLKECNI